MQQVMFNYICTNNMSIIRFPLLFAGSLGEKKLLTLFDSEATMSCINPDLLENLAVKQPLGITRRVKFSNDSNCFTEIKEAVCLDFYINDVLLSDDFCVIPVLSEEVIIGAATIRKWRIKLDFEHGSINVDPNAARLKLI